MKDYNEYWFGFFVVFLAFLCISLVLIDERLGVYLPLVLGFFLVSIGSRKIYKHKCVKNWNKTNATIESFEIVEKVAPSEHGKEKCFYPKARYSFEVSDSHFTSTQISLDIKNICFDSKDDSSAFIKGLIKKGPRVYYRKNNPNDCLLVPELGKKRKTHYISMISAGAILIFIGVILISIQ